MRGEERRGWRKINRRRYPSGRRGGGKSGGDEDWSHTERLVVNAFVIRCKSRRFVVSPLTAAEKHENRRCTRRNTIIRPVNKFLQRGSTRDEIELSDRFPGIAFWLRSKSFDSSPSVSSSRSFFAILPFISRASIGERDS